MSALDFAAPQYGHLLWVVAAVLIVLAWLDRRGTAALNRFVSQALQPRLVERPSAARRRLKLVLLAAAGIAMTLALMRPQWGTHVVTTPRSGAEIMIALDVSRSMLAEDVVPNRLERAKAEIRDLLGLLEGDQVGLIAFAGRAAILAPLTPDFGFVELALKDARPAIVGRGGTRLEEPIRKAVRGFGRTGNVSRSILLITDGEDHDSFPVQAARDAAEQGVRILAIGFGDEAGAEIVFTDPATGARGPIRDSEDRVVISRLDGELLRELASVTGGAYIPAGTGLLDLEAIHAQHIAPLTRGKLDGRERIVRNDVYQWPLLLAMLCLVGAVASTARAGEKSRRTGLASAILCALSLGLLFVSPTTALAEDTQSRTGLAKGSQDSAGQSPDRDVGTGASGVSTAKDADQAPPAAPDSSTADSGAAPVPVEPRVAYNEALEALAGDKLDLAERLFEAARTAAAEDAQVRYRATFNRSWVAVERADAALEAEAPEKALEHLRVAGRWFAEAVRLRPDEEAPRRNLELVMRRAMQLEDSLAGRDESKVSEQLDALIDSQRAFMAELGAHVGASATESVHTSDATRRTYRALATRAIAVLSETQTLESRVARDANALANKDEPDAESQLGQTQLEGVLVALQTANMRIAQSRARLRRAAGAAAYRRAAHALSALQRGRDQLRPPVERIEALMSSAQELGALTSMASTRGLTETTTAPSWLTDKFLDDTQADLLQRARELDTSFETALEREDTATPSEPAALELREQLSAAKPHVEEAIGYFETSRDALSAAQARSALSAQASAHGALDRAREAFMDVRRLIEKTVQVEHGVQDLLGGPNKRDDGTAAEHGAAITGAALGGLASRGHGDNVERMVRLGGKLSEALTKAEARASAGPAPQEQAGPGKEVFERAYELWVSAQTRMHSASDALDALSEEKTPLDFETPPASLGTARARVEEAVEALTELRRLFFSLLEHLRDAAERQRVLNDETQTLAVLHERLEEQDTSARAGPLGHRQASLAQTTGALAKALGEQAEHARSTAAGGAHPQPGSAPGSGGTPAPGASANPAPGAPTPSAQGGSGPSPEQLDEAGELVEAAKGAMVKAAEQLAESAPTFTPLRANQDEALERLAEAIAKLSPPPNPDEQDQQQDQQENQEQNESEGEGEEQRPEGGAERNLAQLLQGVRDREAERRERRARQAAGSERVEKDW